MVYDLPYISNYQQTCFYSIVLSEAVIVVAGYNYR